MKFKVGDYVETSWPSAGVEPGEQGIIIDDSKGQNQLGVMFPAKNDLWGGDERQFLGNFGWCVPYSRLKLICRFKYLLKGGK